MNIENEIVFDGVFNESRVGDYFLNEAKQYKDLIQKIISDDDNVDVTFRKIKLDLNQHEIGILIRLFTETEILPKKQQKYLAESFAHIFSSREQDQLSPLSLEKSAATPDLSAYGAIKDKFSKAIKELQAKTIKTNLSKPKNR